MSIVFSDNFNSGSLTGWGSPNSLGTVNLWGFAGTYCVGCTEPSEQSRKTVGTPIPNGGSIRAQVACILTTTDATDGALTFGAQDFNAGSGTSRYTLLVYLRPDGSFRIRRRNAPGSVVFDNTAAGLFPVNGVQFGLQILFVIGATNTVEFVVNNVSVATISWGFSHTANQWDDIWLYGWALPVSGPRPPYTSLVLIDNYEVDDSASAVSWPAGTAPQLDLARTCLLAPVSSDPVPIKPPPAPQAPCEPESEVSSGGTGKFGCNTGGTGFVSMYAGPYDTVPQHDDPDPGETFAGKRTIDFWFDWRHRNPSTSPVSTDRYQRAKMELGHFPAYEGGRKPGGLKAFGRVSHALGNEMHAFETAGVSLQYADQSDRLVRTITDGQSVRNDELLLKGTSPEGAATNTPPKILARSLIQRARMSAPMGATIDAVDQISTYFNTRKHPHWTCRDLGNAIPFAPVDILDRPLTPLYGEKSDEGADPISRGLISGMYCGKFDLTSSGLPTPPATPGYTFEALVAALQASVDANTTDADWGGCIGHADAAVLEEMGTVPNDYTRLASVIGYGDLDAVLDGICGGGTTPPPDDTEWGLFIFGLAEWFRLKVYASNLQGGDANAEQTRVFIDPSSRSDILHPDFHPAVFPNRYLALTNTDTGRTFWVMAVYLRGGLLEDAINGRISVTANAIGIMGNAGLPLIDAHACEQHWHENFVQNDWSSGPWTDDWNYPQWADGTPKVNTTSFATCQALTVGPFGSPDRGLTIGWFPREIKTLKQCVDDWDRETESKTGFNGDWQVVKYRFDPDMTGFTRVDHAEHVFGSIRYTPGEDPENVISGSCDYDPDGGAFRAVLPTPRTNAEGITYQGEEMPGDAIDSVILNDLTQLAWVLDQRLLRLRFGSTYIDVPRDIGAWDVDLASGVSLTTIEGTGASGFVGRRCVKLRRELDLDSRIVTDTLWDVERLLADTSPTLSLQAGTLGYAGRVLTVDGPRNLSLPSGSLALTGNYIGIAFNQPIAGSLVFSGYAPTVS